MKLQVFFVVYVLYFTIAKCFSVLPVGNFSFNHFQDELRRHGFKGRAYPKGDYGYEVFRIVRNGACNHNKPLTVVRPLNTYDVSAIVKVVRKLNLPISVRSGGHSYLCQSMQKDTVHIDMRKINRIDHTPEENYKVIIFIL